jgi:hypothetical protein
VSPVLEPCLERLMSGRSPVVLTWQWCKSAAELCELVAMSFVSSMHPFCRGRAVVCMGTSWCMSCMLDSAAYGSNRAQ